MRKIDLDEEKKYENDKVNGSDIRENQSKYYWSTGVSSARQSERIKKYIQGKIVLEIGCSEGGWVEECSEYAKEIIGVDLSDAGIKKARARNIVNAEFICCDAHDMPFNDDEFDVVIVTALLHHLDLMVAIKEIKRVLKHKGIFIFNEPLGTNPLFYMYRLMTPYARTSAERPFTFRDLRILQKSFDMEYVVFFGFICLASSFFRIHILRKVLTKLDDIVSNTWLRYFYWQIAGVGINNKK